MKKAIIILCFLGLFSCDYKPRKITSENVLARVYNEYLYESDLKGIIPKGMSVNDSIMFARNYINNWVKQKLLINKAEKFEDVKKKSGNMWGPEITYYPADSTELTLGCMVIEGSDETFFGKMKNDDQVYLKFKVVVMENVKTCHSLFEFSCKV